MQATPRPELHHKMAARGRTLPKACLCHSWGCLKDTKPWPNRTTRKLWQLRVGVSHYINPYPVATRPHPGPVKLLWVSPEPSPACKRQGSAAPQGSRQRLPVSLARGLRAEAPLHQPRHRHGGSGFQAAGTSRRPTLSADTGVTKPPQARGVAHMAAAPAAGR